MTSISSKTSLALAIVISSSLTGCTTTAKIGTALSTPFGYVKDHPNTGHTTDYQVVKEWAYDVSDGYSSRGTMNRYSLYWGGALAAGGAGALGGMAATGGSGGHASVIIPLAGAFIGTLFVYYKNEQQAKLYYAASDSIKSLIIKSEKRQFLNPNETKILEEILNNEKAKLDAEKKENELTKAKLDKVSGALETLSNAPPKTKLGSKRTKDTADSKALEDLKNLPKEAATTINKVKEEADSKTNDTQKDLAIVETRLKNIKLLNASINHALHEVHCLTDDVNAVMRKVQIHLAQLDPKNVSEDLSKIKAKDPKDTTAPTSPVTGFDLSDLDSTKIVSACEIEL